jgi:endoglucanase
LAPARHYGVRNDQVRLLERLCSALGVSGDEGEVRQIVLSELRSQVDDLRVDPLGSVLAVKRGKGQRRPLVMLAAHMDEVGLMIVQDDGQGFYRFETVGGLDSRYLPGKRVIVGKAHLPGVIGATPPHTLEGAHPPDYTAHDLRIELGPDAQVAVGERATFAPEFTRSGSTIMAKGIDDRIGVATLIELVRQAPTNIDLAAAFTVQEEIGARGAQAAARRIAPDLAIIIESTPALETPPAGLENVTYNTRLGLGPAIYVADKTTVYNRPLVDILYKAAARASVPSQTRQPGRGGTDAQGVQGALAGIPCAAVAVPHRHPHSPLSIARVDDWAETIHLLSTALKMFTPGLVASLRK